MTSPADFDWRCPGCAAPRPAPLGDGSPCPACGVELRRGDGFWVADPAFRPERFPAGRREHLATLEAGHFWFEPRRRLFASLLDRWAGGRFDAALELGCGSGGFLPDLVARAGRVAAVEAWPESLGSAAARGTGALLLQGSATRLPFADRSFDLVVALDVLEHEEPAALLGEAARLLRPGGALFLSVPAFRSLWSELDEAAGHRVRHTRATLAAELAASGWRIERTTHYQALLFPLVWLVRRLPGGSLRRAERRPSAVANALLGRVNALEVATLSSVSLPFGSSLVALARKGA